MSDRRPAPAVELARFAGLFEPEERTVARDDIRDMLRSAFGRALMGVRVQNGARGPVILAVLQ